LKRLNPRPEMVGPRRRRTHKIWYRCTRLTVRAPSWEPQEWAKSQKTPDALKSHDAEVKSPVVPSSERHGEFIRLAEPPDVMVVMSRSHHRIAPALRGCWRIQRQKTERKATPELPPFMGVEADDARTKSHHDRTRIAGHADCDRGQSICFKWRHVGTYKGKFSSLQPIDKKRNRDRIARLPGGAGNLG
jgi:hypothetical protein